MLEIEKANEFARRFFNETAGVGLDDVEAAIRKQDNSLREERIFFGLDDRWLVQQCGHYLLFGSEYILSIAADLTRTFGEEIDYRRFLKRRVNTTVVV